MAERLAAVGVRILLAAKLTSAQPCRDAGARMVLADDGPVEAERVLVAAGCEPRTSGLGLETLGLRLGVGAGGRDR